MKTVNVVSTVQGSNEPRGHFRGWLAVPWSHEHSRRSRRCITFHPSARRSWREGSSMAHRPGSHLNGVCGARIHCERLRRGFAFFRPVCPPPEWSRYGGFCDARVARLGDRRVWNHRADHGHRLIFRRHRVASSAAKCAGNLKGLGRRHNCSDHPGSWDRIRCDRTERPIAT